MVGIYRIKNKINGKSYIGQSKSVQRRWREHIRGTEDSVISKAIRKYGEDNFTFEIIEICSVEDLDSREIYYIKKYETYKKGYNMTLGGDGVKGYGRVLSYDIVPEIIAELKEGVPTSEIASKYRISTDMVNRINNGHDWVIEGESYPIRETYQERLRKTINKDELLKDVAVLGFKGAGNKYGLTGNGIKARCRIVGLPTKIKDIRELYGIREPRIEATYKGEKIDVESIEELILYIKENELTYANKNNIRVSIRRVLRGERKSYLGINIKEID